MPVYWRLDELRMFMLCSFCRIVNRVFPMMIELEGPSRLFFSVFPDPLAAACIGQTTQKLRREYGFSGQPLLGSRFHCSLCSCEENDRAPPAFVAEAREAAATVRVPAFEVSFNCAKSFSGREAHHPLVLTGEDGVVGLTMLYSSLCTAMRGVGFRPKAPSAFTPHVTLLYDRLRINERFIDPICWTVREFILVLSSVGRTRYDWMGRWQLRG
jgi:2'-5' RNA ligase